MSINNIERVIWFGVFTALCCVIGYGSHVHGKLERAVEEARADEMECHAELGDCNVNEEASAYSFSACHTQLEGALDEMDGWISLCEGRGCAEDLKECETKIRSTPYVAGALTFCEAASDEYQDLWLHCISDPESVKDKWRRELLRECAVSQHKINKALDILDGLVEPQ